MELIEFQGKKYPVVIINMPFGERKISTESLNESLMNTDGSYVSESAIFVDESIFYFVSDKNIVLESDSLAKLILSEI
jgi:hypothetical protein